MGEENMKDQKIQSMAVSGLLCAVGIVIPLFSPVKIVLEPASFTLASHVAVMIAMFLSPGTAAFVSLGTTLGFLLGGFPLVVVLRALTHIAWAVPGAMYLQKHPHVLGGIGRALPFSFCLGILHALCEVAVVIPFYFGENLTSGYYEQGFLVSVILLVGVGSLIHSMVDFALSQAVWAPLSRRSAHLRRA